MKMIDKIKEYIGKQAFSTQDKAELEASELNF
jgi:hypothetical protein